MIDSVTIGDIRRDKAFYLPEEEVILSVLLKSDIEQSIPINMIVEIRHLNSLVDDIKKAFTFNGPEQVIDVHYTPPPDAPRGYGVDIYIEANKRSIAATASSAFDVLDHWTQTPRYGFLTDFFPGRSDYAETMENLIRFQINGLQFYDWMYRHDQFLTKTDPYRDPLDRLLSRDSVEKLIAAAHEHNIAAMPYTAIYAASVPFYEEHPDWALYQASGDPYRLGENFLIYMDPRPDSPWVEHLLDQFDQVLSEMEFDGIHLDQYGDPKAAQDARGKSFNLDVPIAATIDLTKERVQSRQAHGVVIFNAVNNWPIETVAQSSQDLIYIEVWRPHIWYEDLHKLIVNAQELSGGKPVVLAAYINPSLEHNARLIDAVIFASGGGHIELGERNGMLAEPYFPKYESMSLELSTVMQHYYDFLVRYQDVIGPRTEDASEEVQGWIEIEGVSTDPRLQKDKVWPIARKGEGFLAVSLINLLGIDSPEWLKAVEDPPRSLGPTSVWIRGLDHAVSGLWYATPDTGDPSPQSLPFELLEEGDGYGLSFQIPSLTHWCLLTIEWEL